jgi:hypothetical protein
MAHANYHPRQKRAPGKIERHGKQLPVNSYPQVKDQNGTMTVDFVFGGVTGADGQAVLEITGTNNTGKFVTIPYKIRNAEGNVDTYGKVFNITSLP